MVEEAAQQPPQGMHPSFVNVIRQKERVKKSMASVKHKIGVYSAKGGVGKTTIAVNIAYSLSAMGFKVGLLDADIDCPNLTMFLGINEMLDTSQVPLIPLNRHGVKVVSTAMLVDDVSKPVIWRGPMIAKMLGEFFENVAWGELDYLVIDLPPGTSDSPLTIMQVLELNGFVIVTNPQRIASINSVRSGIMAKRLNVRLLGVVENMSKGEISGNTVEAVKKLGSEMIGTVGSNPLFNAFSDSGKIPVMEDGSIAREFLHISKKIVELTR